MQKITKKRLGKKITRISIPATPLTAAEQDRKAELQAECFTPRYVAICIPGDEERGDASHWYVMDRATNRSSKMTDRQDAIQEAAHLNQKAGIR